MHDDPHLHPLLGDDRVTLMGLLMEAHAGVRTTVEADLDLHGVTGSAFEVLVRLGRSPGHRLRMTELADQSTLSNSGLTRVIDRLLASGYVVRERHERDRRVCFAVLTPHGYEQLLAVLPSHLDAIDRCLTDVLAPDELEAFERTLRKVRAAVRPMADADADHLASATA